MPTADSRQPTAVSRRLLVGDDDLASVDRLDDVVWGLAVDGASDRLCGTQDLLDAASEVLCE